MARKRTSIPVRFTRLARLSLHLFRGLWIASTRYPRLTAAQQNHELQRWSRRLLAILNVHVTCAGTPERWPERCMLVLNHVSWLDIFAVYSVTPAVFVAKSEIARWPLVGALVARVGTLFIERGSRAHARRMNENLVATLVEGRVVAVCPEGTTTFGRELKPFHAALLQPAIDAGAMVQPLALRYVDRHGEHTVAAAYVGDQSLLASIWMIACEPRIGVDLAFADQIVAAPLHRRDLTRACEAVIALSLAVTPPVRGRPTNTGSGTPADPRAGPPSGTPPTRSPYPAQEDQAVS